MKRNIIKVMAIILALTFLAFPVSNIMGAMQEGSEDIIRTEDTASNEENSNSKKALSSKKIVSKITSVSSAKITIKTTNNTNDDIVYSGRFVLEEFKKGKWGKISFKEGVAFAKSYWIFKNSTDTRVIKWKDYFGKNLSDGKYRIKWISTNEFAIKYTKIKTKVVSSSGSGIKLQVINNSSKDFKYTNSFKVKQYKKGKWKTVPLKKGATFSSSKTLKPGKSATVTIKWKKYLGKNLSDGKYRIYWAKNKVNKFTLKYTKIKTNVASTSGSGIKLKITNKSSKKFKYTNSFKVKQYKKGK